LEEKLPTATHELVVTQEIERRVPLDPGVGSGASM
jgi:hypothetical protein